MRFIQITSKENRLLKTLRLVAAQSRKVSPDLVLAEGIRVVEEATQAGLPVEFAIASDEFGKTPKDGALLERLKRNNIPIYRAANAIFRSVSEVVAPQGILALVRIPRASLATVPNPAHPLVLCAWGIQDPGNLGTLIRTASAAGSSWVCALKGTVSARNPKAIRSSAGAFFRIPVVEGLGVMEFLEFCRKHSIRAYRTTPHSGSTYSRVDLCAGCAFVLGNEGGGIPAPEWLDLPALCIPMAQGSESLNVAAAGAVLMFEALRQRSNQKAQSAGDFQGPSASGSGGRKS